MSIKAELKQKIYLYMLQHIDTDDKNLVNKAVDAFNVSRTTIYNYLKQMVTKNIIQKSEKCSCKYELVSTGQIFRYSTDTQLEEDRLYDNDIFPLIKNLSKNVQDIWRYIFTEIMNNAIEHANASEILCRVEQNYLFTEIAILDNGIGIFKKIQQFFKENGENISLDEAVDSLFPGKLTTDSNHHSGEGIFFSSRLADRFYIQSSGKIFTHNTFNDFKFSMPEEINFDGTTVFIRLANNSHKQIKDVFDMFSNPDVGFFKTQIPIAHMFETGYPVSRSEARRLGTCIKAFEEVDLDFKNVSNIGQAFTHEIFVVFTNNNPDIKISFSNANDDISKMIRRVVNTK